MGVHRALHQILTQPPRLPRALDRPRVQAVLAGGDEPGRLVVAPSGSGKTVAAAQVLAVAAAGGRRTGWCRLAMGAAGGPDLVRLVGAALGVDVEEPGAGPLERASVLLDTLGDQPTTVVIDDYDLGRPEECDPILAEVLALAPPECRIVVCSAARPAGLVGRASVGQLRLVGPDDLAFDEAEVAALLALYGRDPSGAPALHAASGGWPAAVAVLAESAGSTTSLDAAVAKFVLGATHSVAPSTSFDHVLAALALAPSLGAAELAALGFEPAVLTRVAEESALLRPVGDRWALLDIARDPVLRHLPATTALADVAARVAPVLAETDPVAAAAVLLDVEDDAGAADLLARHAAAVAPDDVLPLLYRMRADVRRRLPPSLSAARATVEVDGALADAERRLATATAGRETVEAQVALGAFLVHRGQLSSACAQLEAALRSPRGVAPQASAAAVGWLGLARLWAGDVDGAAATVVAPEAPLARWVAAEVALFRDDLGAAAETAKALRETGWTCAAEAVSARVALADGAESAAAGAAARSYQQASVEGGFDLVVAGPVHAWCLARAGRWDEAGAVVDALRRRVGAVDTCARLHADLIAEAAAHARDDAVAAARHAQAIAATRRLGFAVVETTARRWLRAPAPAQAGAGLHVAVLGPVEVWVDGARLDDGSWRSRKAREVLVVLALAGEAGLDRDEVVEAVWPDRDPVRGRTLLRTALAEVRRVLEPTRPPGEPSRFVVTRAGRITVAAGTDLAQVRDLWSRHRPGEAWARFRGPAVSDDPYAPAFDALRAEAQRLQLDVAEALVGSPAPPSVQLDAARFVLEVEPWRTEVVERVAAACRAAGDDIAAAQAARLRGET